MKLGRNDPCHCGSGKKYKKCHMEGDLARARTEKSLATVSEWVRFHATDLAELVARGADNRAEIAGAADRFFAGTDVPEAPLSVGAFREHVVMDLPLGDDEAPLIAAAAVEDDDPAGSRKEALREVLARTVASYFEISDVRRGTSVRLTDRVLDRSFVVRDATLADTLDPMEVVLGRVLTFEKTNVLLDGWERVFFHGRKAAIADVSGALEAVHPVPAEETHEDPESDEAKAAAEARSEAAAARRAWLKAETPRLFVQARAADAQRARFGM
jgi:hypothetical protein